LINFLVDHLSNPTNMCHMHSHTFGRSCDKQVKERDGATEKNEDTARSCGKLAALPTRNDTALKGFISFHSASVLRNKICWVVAPCVWVISFRRFE